MTLSHGSLSTFAWMHMGGFFSHMPSRPRADIARGRSSSSSSSSEPNPSSDLVERCCAEGLAETLPGKSPSVSLAPSPGSIRKAAVVLKLPLPRLQNYDTVCNIVLCTRRPDSIQLQTQVSATYLASLGLFLKFVEAGLLPEIDVPKIQRNVTGKHDLR